VDELGNIQEWQLEWKWDGIRAQVVKKGERVELWSRGEERVTESFPDLVSFFSKIPQDFVLDGEILGGKSGEIGSFNELQKRLNRKAPSAAMQRDHPVAFLAYDYLREGTEPLTALPLAERRGRLELFSAPIRNEHFDVSPLVAASTWEEAGRLHAQSRIKKAEGLMVKRKDAPYATGRKRGIWFKWKVDPLTLDVVLTSAQPGTGRRASLYTDYTFSIWKEDQLVPIAKAYSGLSDSEIQELDSWIRQNTLGRFGPVRSLRPERVFEIGFEGIGVSTRHKAGFAVRFPRILRERTDKPAAEADRVETVQELLKTLEIDTPRKPSAPPAETESLQGKLL
jgi:DNA ligase-1